MIYSSKQITKNIFTVYLPGVRAVGELEKKLDSSTVKTSSLEVYYNYSNVPNEQSKRKIFLSKCIDKQGKEYDVKLYLWEQEGLIKGVIVLDSDFKGNDYGLRCCERKRFL